MGDLIFPRPSDSIVDDPYYYRHLFNSVPRRTYLLDPDGSGDPASRPLVRLRQLAADIDHLSKEGATQPPLLEEAHLLYDALPKDAAAVHALYLVMGTAPLAGAGSSSILTPIFRERAEELLYTQLRTQRRAFAQTLSAKAVVELSERLLAKTLRSWAATHKSGTPAWQSLLG